MHYTGKLTCTKATSIENQRYLNSGDTRKPQNVHNKVLTTD